MSFAGNWNTEVNTPIGMQKGTDELKVEGDKLSGTLVSPQGLMAVEGSVTGNTATWVGQATSPMPMKLTFDVTLDGDSFSGAVKAGLFGKFNIKATRA